MASAADSDQNLSTDVLPGKGEAPCAAARELIARLRLEPHPEGGWFRELHRAEGAVRRQGDGQERSGLTLIVYLLQRGERSRWHRVRGSDEIWLHAAGAPLDLWSLPPEGGRAQRLGLGSLTEIPAMATRTGAARAGEDDPVSARTHEGEAAAAGEGPGERAGAGEPEGGGDGEDLPSRVIPADWWQAARSRGGWTLVHCVVGPGFAFADFEILGLRPAAQRPPGAREDLL